MKIAPLCLTAVFCIVSATLWAQASDDPFARTFSNQNLVFELEARSGGYAGTVSVGGQAFSVQAQKLNATTLQGTYDYYGLAIPFQATLQGNTLTLSSEGEVFRLTRQGGSGAAKTEAGHLGEVVEPYWGIRFKSPEGWIPQKTPAGYLLGSHTKKGFILVMQHDYTNVEQLRAAASEGLIDENGTALQLSGEVEAFGKQGVAANFEGTVEWQPAKAYAVGLLSPHGGGVTILTAVETGSFSDDYRGYVRAIAQSMVFSKPETPPVAEGWKQKLNGARLTYMDSYYSGGVDGSYVGASEKEIIDLCPQGYFNFSGHSSLAVDGGTGGGYNASGFSGGNKQGSGTWEVVHRGNETVLTLRFHNGQVSEYTVTEEDGKTFLNGRRYFRTYANSPVESGRPQCW